MLVELGIHVARHANAISCYKYKENNLKLKVQSQKWLSMRYSIDFMCTYRSAYQFRGYVFGHVVRIYTPPPPP